MTAEKKPAAPKAPAKRTPYTERDRALMRIQTKLERWELNHLRDHARHQADRIEALHEQLTQLREELVSAEDRAEWWRQQVMDMTEQLAEDTGRGVTLGITRTGLVGLITTRENAA
jgi:chromosome segregation ATPase